jgi:hypothetical protein
LAANNAKKFKNWTAKLPIVREIARYHTRLCAQGWLDPDCCFSWRLGGSIIVFVLLGVLGVLAANFRL